MYSVCFCVCMCITDLFMNEIIWCRSWLPAKTKFLLLRVSHIYLFLRLVGNCFLFGLTTFVRDLTRFTFILVDFLWDIVYQFLLLSDK